MRVGGGIFWVDGVDGCFLWVGGGVWKFFMGEWGWVKVYFGW